MNRAALETDFLIPRSVEESGKIKDIFVTPDIQISFWMIKNIFLDCAYSMPFLFVNDNNSENVNNIYLNI